MHHTWRAMTLLVFVASHACVATSLRLEFSSTDDPQRVDVVRFLDATNATRSEVEELVFKYCLGACIPRSSCSSLRDAVVADSTVASMRESQPVAVRVPVDELRVHKTDVVVDGRAVELAVAMGCSVRDAASQFCVTHRLVAHQCASLEVDVLKGIQATEVEASAACAHFRQSCDPTHLPVTPDFVRLHQIQSARRQRFWWRSRTLENHPECLVAVVIANDKLSHFGMDVTVTPLRDATSSTGLPRVQFVRHNTSDYGVNWFFDVLLSECPCAIELVPYRGASLQGPTWDPPLRKPDVAIVANNLFAPTESRGNLPGHVDAVRFTVSEAIRLVEDAGIPRIGLYLTADEFNNYITDAYAVFDFVLRHYRDASRWPLTMAGRPVQEHVGPVGDAVAAVRTSAAAASIAALHDLGVAASTGEATTPRRLFGTWSRNRVVHMPLGVFGPFVPIDNASDASGPQPFVYNPHELLLGKPRLASERQFFATFIGNRHPKKATRNWSGYSFSERAAAIQALESLHADPPLDGYDVFVHATAQFNAMEVGSENTTRSAAASALHDASVRATGEQSIDFNGARQYPWARNGTHNFVVKPLPHPEFRAALQQTVFVVCPRGSHPESFRLYEALEAGAIPIVPGPTPLPGQSSDPSQPTGDPPASPVYNEYVAFMGGRHPLPVVFGDWERGLERTIRQLARLGSTGLDRLQADVRSWWLHSRARSVEATSGVVTAAAFRNDGGPHRMDPPQARQLLRMFSFVEDAVSNVGTDSPADTRSKLLSALALNRAIGRVPYPDEGVRSRLLALGPHSVEAAPPLGDPQFASLLLRLLGSTAMSEGANLIAARAPGSLALYKTAERELNAAATLAVASETLHESDSIVFSYAAQSATNVRLLDQAARHFRMALHIDPCNPHILTALGQFYGDLRNPDTAAAMRAVATSAEDTIQRLGLPFLPLQTTHCYVWGGHYCDPHVAHLVLPFARDGRKLDQAALEEAHACADAVRALLLQFNVGSEPIQEALRRSLPASCVETVEEQVSLWQAWRLSTSRSIENAPSLLGAIAHEARRDVEQLLWYWGWQCEWG